MPAGARIELQIAPKDGKAACTHEGLLLLVGQVPGKWDACPWQEPGGAGGRAAEPGC